MADPYPRSCAPRRRRSGARTRPSSSTGCATPRRCFLHPRARRAGHRTFAPFADVAPAFAFESVAAMTFPIPLAIPLVILFSLRQDVKQSAAALAARAVQELRAKGGAAARKDSKQRRETKQKEQEDAREAAREAAIALRTELAQSIEERKAAAEASKLKMSTLTAAQMSSWDAEDVQALSGADLAAMKPSQFRTLTGTQLAALKPQQIMQLGAKHIQALPSDVLQKLAPEMIKMLPEDFLKNLTDTQVSSLSADQICAMTSEQLESYNGRQFARLDSTHLNAVERWSKARRFSAAGSEGVGMEASDGAPVPSTTAGEKPARRESITRSRRVSSTGTVLTGASHPDTDGSEGEGQEEFGGLMLVMTEGQLAKMSEEQRAGATVVDSEKLMEDYARGGDGSSAVARGRGWASAALKLGRAGMRDSVRAAARVEGDAVGDVEERSAGRESDDNAAGDNLHISNEEKENREVKEKQTPPAPPDVNELAQASIEEARRREQEWLTREDDEILDDIVIVIVPDPKPPSRPFSPELEDGNFEYDADLMDQLTRAEMEKAAEEARKAQLIAQVEAEAAMRAAEMAEAARREAELLAAPATEVDDDGIAAAADEDELMSRKHQSKLTAPVPIDIDALPAEAVGDEECVGDGRDEEDEREQEARKAARVEAAAAKAAAADAEVTAAAARLMLETLPSSEVDAEDECIGYDVEEEAAMEMKGKTARISEARMSSSSRATEIVEDEYGDDDFDEDVVDEATTASVRVSNSSVGRTPRVSQPMEAVDEDVLAAGARLSQAEPRVSAASKRSMASVDEYSDDEFEEEIVEEELSL